MPVIYFNKYRRKKTAIERPPQAVDGHITIRPLDDGTHAVAMSGLYSECPHKAVRALAQTIDELIKRISS